MDIITLAQSSPYCLVLYRGLDNGEDNEYDRLTIIIYNNATSFTLITNVNVCSHRVMSVGAKSTYG